MICALIAIVIGCSKSIIIDIAEQKKEEEYKTRAQADSTAKDDTLVPISFSVSVEGWNELIID